MPNRYITSNRLSLLQRIVIARCFSYFMYFIARSLSLSLSLSLPPSPSLSLLAWRFVFLPVIIYNTSSFPLFPVWPFLHVFIVVRSSPSSCSLSLSLASSVFPSLARSLLSFSIYLSFPLNLPFPWSRLSSSTSIPLALLAAILPPQFSLSLFFPLSLHPPSLLSRRRGIRKRRQRPGQKRPKESVSVTLGAGERRKYTRVATYSSTAASRLRCQRSPRLVIVQSRRFSANTRPRFAIGTATFFHRKARRDLHAVARWLVKQSSRNRAFAS